MCDVLLADDDARIRRAFVWYLERRGHTIRTASDGDETLAQMLERPPRLLLLDLHMPRVSGQEVLDAMMREPRLWGTRVIVVSAFATSLPKRAPVVAVHEKAADIERLLELVRGYCGCGETGAAAH